MRKEQIITTNNKQMEEKGMRTDSFTLKRDSFRHYPGHLWE